MMKDKKNEPFLRRLLDPDAPDGHFHSDYLDLDIDWSAMSVLCCGVTPVNKFSAAIKSRLEDYVAR